MATRLSRLSVARNKAAWGISTVGLARSARGFATLAGLSVRRPTHATVSLRSGYDLRFAYPSQLPTMLVSFGDLVDPEYPFLRRIARPGMVVVDVGAAIGQFTVFAARLPGATVHAFEPSSSNLETLHSNLQLNHVTGNVSVHQVALGAQHGTGRFETAGRTWVSGLDPTGRSETAETVPVRTLPEQLAELGIEHVDVLKVNVAGYEPEVLTGALPVLREGRVDVLILLLGLRSMAHYRSLLEIGYRLFFFEPRASRLHEVLRGDESLLACRPSPARHIIAMRGRAMAAGLAHGVPIVPAVPR
jgi:FkbM family methyltransferase